MLKEFNLSYGKQVEVYYRKPIHLTSELGGVRMIVGVKGILKSETQNFIKLKDISDIVRDEQAFAAQEPEQNKGSVYISKRNIGSLYVQG